MSDFLSFVRSLGIIINDYPPVGRWVRLPTDDKPRHRNGAVKWLGDRGFAQNHATQTNVAVWRPDAQAKEIDRGELSRKAKVAQDEIEAGQKRAADRAEWILSQCELATHPYLAGKGFPDEMANVWTTNGTRLLVIPMRVGQGIVGCQLIDEAGGKKFLAGQRTSDAAFVAQNKGLPVLCEGYATGLSIKAAMTALRARYSLFVCFSAHNLGRIAKTLPKGLIVADNDASGTGERVARETGWPYFMPPEVGHDFNDFHQSTSLFKCSQALRSALLAT
jgi:putative DNA primase/helicase